MIHCILNPERLPCGDCQRGANSATPILGAVLNKPTGKVLTLPSPVSRCGNHGIEGLNNFPQCTQLDVGGGGANSSSLTPDLCPPDHYATLLLSLTLLSRKVRADILF